MPPLPPQRRSSDWQLFLGAHRRGKDLLILDPMELEDLIPAPLRVREGSGDVAAIHDPRECGSCCFL